MMGAPRGRPGGLAWGALAHGTTPAGPGLVQCDLLEWAHGDDPLDVVVSTYAIHHLEEPEKVQLLHALARRLRPERGGACPWGEGLYAISDDWPVSS